MMGEKCEKCEAEINDATQDCRGCRYRIREERLTKQLAMAIEAIEAWRGVNDYLSMTLEVVTNITKGFSEALESLNKGENHESSD